VYKSTKWWWELERGHHWPDQHYGVPALAIDPATPTTIYAGADTGVSKSIDDGVSWSVVIAGLTNTYVYTVVIDPLTPTTLYAGTGVGRNGYGGGSVFKSTDGGETWSAASAGLPKHDGINSDRCRPDYGAGDRSVTPTTLYAEATLRACTKAPMAAGTGAQ